MSKRNPTSRPFSFATAVRITIHELQASGDMTTAALVDEVISRYPDLVEARSKAFIRDSIAKEARRTMKTTLDFVASSDGQFSLKLNDMHLPNSLSLPPVNGAKDVTWVPLEEVTYRQLKSNITLLNRSVNFDLEKLRQMQQLEAELRPLMEKRYADNPIKPFLVRLAQRAA